MTALATPLKVGFLGAGYIASWHKDALARIGAARLVGVCDLSRAAAEALAGPAGARVYASLEDMLAPGEIDVAHVLTPPPAHYEAVRRILEAGKHAFVEKPLALSAAEGRELAALAGAKGVRLAVDHNFLMLPGYDRFRRGLDLIGPVDTFAANWRLPLPALRSGPYGSWMLRAPRNLFLELAPHLFAFLADLFDEFTVNNVALRHPIELPGGIIHHQGFCITGLAGRTAAQIDISLIEGPDERSIEARGLGGRARFDFAGDVCTIERPSMGDIVIGPLAARFGLAAQSAATALGNFGREAASLNALAPYGLGVTRACRSFYASLAGGEPVDRRLSAALAARALAMIEDALRLAAPQFQRELTAAPGRSAKPASVLVIGGSGFIGRHLVEALLRAGFGVRVFSRGAAGFRAGQVEVFTGDVKSESDLLAAMAGIDAVFHLARAEEKTWQGYLDNDVAVAALVGECCVKAGVRRLVYAGTIDCYDASQPHRRVSEETPFDERLEERNLYARSKAACEQALLGLAATRGLPLVIVRPGIVVGRGGPLRHWGIAMWRGPTACKLWGRGDNILPFVAASDVADGLVRAMTASGIEGRAFNLVGEPLLSARDYLSAVERAHGVKMRARPTPMLAYYLVDLAKYWAKRLLARRTGLARPSYRDWRSRAQLSAYDNSAAKSALGWRPIADRDAFLRETVNAADLFGLGAGQEAPAAKRAGPGAPPDDSLTRPAIPEGRTGRN